MSSSLIEILIKATDKASKTVDGVKSSLNDLDKSGGDANESVENVIASLGSGFPVFAGFVAASAAAAQALYKLGEAGASIQRMSDTSSQVAMSYGSDMDDIVSSVRSASLNTVSNYDIMAASSRAMMFGLETQEEKLANLMQVAAFRGRAMGISTTQAFNDIVTGVGRMSPLILDNLGIIVDAETNYANYAASIGKTSNQLTVMEKRQALLNAVLSEGNKMLAEAGGLEKDAASEYEEFSARIQNTKNALLELISDAVTPYVREANKQLEITEFINRAVDKHIITQAEAIKIISELRNGTADYDTTMGELTEKMRIQKAMQDDLNSRYSDSRTLAEQAVEAHEPYIATQEQLAEVLAGTAQWQKDLNKALEDSAAAAKKAAIDYADLATELSGQVTNAQLAKLAIDAITEAYNSPDSKISRKQYLEAIRDIQVQYGLATDSGYAWADGVMNMNEILASGLVPTENMGEALGVLREAVETGNTSVGGLVTVLESLGLISSDAADQLDGSAARMNKLELGEAIAEAGGLANYLNQIASQPAYQKKTIDVVTTNYNRTVSLGSREYQYGFGEWSERATGGDVSAGMPYIVGEKRPEVFVPQTDGYIYPSVGDYNRSSGRTSGAQSINIYLDGEKIFRQLLADNIKAQGVRA